MSTVPTPDSPSWPIPPPDGPDTSGTGGSWRSWAIAAVVTVIIVAVGVVVINHHSGKSSAASASQTANGQTQGSLGAGRGFNGAFGKVVAVDGATLTIDSQDQSGSTTKVTVKSSSDTKVSETVDGSGSDLKVGDNVVAFGTATSDGVKATQITDRGDEQDSFGPGGGTGTPPSGAQGELPQGGFPQGEVPQGGFPQGGEVPQGGLANGGGLVAGSITKVDGSTITVKSSDGSTKTITTTSSTKISVSQARKISDIKVGDTIQATGDRSGDVVTATSIRLGAGGFGGGGFPGGGFPGAGGTNSSTPTTTN